ncbi:MAG TPA: helix-turn-helix domain-containing protein, partial [Intrasporangium sp.]|nr:helix-turn-helix domain-containing protein [Intrasporangium sp.]
MFIGERAAHEAKDGDHADHGSPLESRTRSRVLHMVSAEGPITAAELGRHLDLTPAAVRRHLDALVEQGA